MLPQRKPWFRLVPTLSFASGMAVLLLVLTFAFSSLPGLTGARSIAALPPAATQAASAPNLAAPRADQSSPSAGSPPIIVWGGGSGGAGGGGGGDGTGIGGGSGQAVGLGGAPAMTETVPPGKGGDTGIPTPETGIGGGEPLPTQPPVAPELTPTPPETGTGSPSIAAQPTETPDASKSLTATSQPPAAQSAPSEGSGPILGIRPTQEMGKIVVEPGTDQFYAPPVRSDSQTAPESFVNRYLVAIQIGLGILALATALAAIFLHRKS